MTYLEKAISFLKKYSINQFKLALLCLVAVFFTTIAYPSLSETYTNQKNITVDPEACFNADVHHNKIDEIKRLRSSKNVSTEDVQRVVKEYSENCAKTEEDELLILKYGKRVNGSPSIEKGALDNKFNNESLFVYLLAGTDELISIDYKDNFDADVVLIDPDGVSWQMSDTSENVFLSQKVGKHKIVIHPRYNQRKTEEDEKYRIKIATTLGNRYSDSGHLNKNNIFDEYRFLGYEGKQIYVSMNSNDVDSKLKAFRGVSGNALDTLDDAAPGFNADSEIYLTLPSTDFYIIQAGAFLSNEEGDYNIFIDF